MSPHLRSAIVALVLGMLATGCGDDTSDTEGPRSPTGWIFRQDGDAR